MSRIAKLRSKNGHWFSEAGDPAGRYYAGSAEVSHEDALAEFHRFLADVKSGEIEVASIPPISVNRRRSPSSSVTSRRLSTS